MNTSKSYELPAECAACGGALPDIKERYGRYKDFCSIECRKIGRGFCKACGKPLAQGDRCRRDFCDNKNLCWTRYYRVGEVDTSYQESRTRSNCKRCGKPISQPKIGTKYFCSKRCFNAYRYTPRYGLNDLERWGNYAPETRKVLCELEDAKMPMTAKRLAIAIDREYSLRVKRPIIAPQEKREYGKRVSYTCKACGTDFHRLEFSPLSRDYCSHRCKIRAEQGIEIKHLRGENHPNARITWEQVDEIRRLYASKQMSLREIGKMYGYSEGGISGIVYYRSWKPENDPRRKQEGRLI